MQDEVWKRRSQIYLDAIAMPQTIERWRSSIPKDVHKSSVKPMMYKKVGAEHTSNAPVLPQIKEPYMSSIPKDIHGFSVEPKMKYRKAEAEDALKAFAMSQIEERLASLIPKTINGSSMRPKTKHTIAEAEYTSKASTMSQIKERHSSSILKDIHCSSVKSKTKHTIAEAEDTSNVPAIPQYMDPILKDLHRSSFKPKKVSRPQPARRRRPKQQYHDSQPEEPFYQPWIHCVCDLEEDSDGESTLTRAKNNGTAIYIIDDDGDFKGRSCPHLRECTHYIASYPDKYEPKTVASDFLRILGQHPWLPALNQRWEEKRESEKQALGG